MNIAKNENLVFLVPDCNDNYFLMGDILRGATLDSIENMTTGQKTEERPGAGMVFVYKTANVYRYVGKFPDSTPTEETAWIPDPEKGSFLTLQIHGKD